MHARTVLSGIVYAFPEARPYHSRVAEELEGFGGEQLELRGGHFVPARVMTSSKTAASLARRCSLH